MVNNNKEEKVLILGLSKTGIAAAKYLARQGASCFITELNEKNENNNESCLTDLKNAGIEVEIGRHSDEFIENVTYAVTSPGIPPKSEIFGKLKEKNIKVISEIELAYKNTEIPFVAITGTNGKTTTTMLVSHILSSIYKAPVCGNIGVPPISLIDNQNDYLVCEVSSFQLENTSDFAPLVAVFTNFTPDHINYHGSLKDYFNAKVKMFKNAKYAIFNAKDDKINEFAKNYKGEKFYFDDYNYKNASYIKNNAIYFKQNDIEEKIIDIDDIKLVGHHNYQNVMCSIIVAKLLNVPNEKIEEGIKSFESVEHRIELIQNVKKGIQKFYNDSKATNPEATMVALKSFIGKKVTLLVGGRDKNTSLNEFCVDVKKYINNVIVFGEAKERFYEELKKSGYKNLHMTNKMFEAVDKAIDLNDEIVLLSPACASFDEFKSYEDRGIKFKEYVTNKLS